MSDPVAMRKIKAAAKKRTRAEGAKREATDQLRTYCREARRAGVPVAEIALAAGLSRQGIYDLLG